VLKKVFRHEGIVTAGSSSPLSDGASAVLVVSEAAVQLYGLTPRARVAASASAGVAPNIMGLGQVPATEKAPARAGSASGRGWRCWSSGCARAHEQTFTTERVDPGPDRPSAVFGNHEPGMGIIAAAVCGGDWPN